MNLNKSVQAVLFETVPNFCTTEITNFFLMWKQKTRCHTVNGECMIR